MKDFVKTIGTITVAAGIATGIRYYLERTRIPEPIAEIYTPTRVCDSPDNICREPLPVKVIDPPQFYRGELNDFLNTYFPEEEINLNAVYPY